MHGKVTKITNFGVFVELEEDLEGLLHVSELSDHKVENPQEVVEVGQDLEVKILRVDVEDRKIGLSLKRVQWAAEEDGGQGASDYAADGKRRGGLAVEGGALGELNVSDYIKMPKPAPSTVAAGDAAPAEAPAEEAAAEATADKPAEEAAEKPAAEEAPAEEAAAEEAPAEEAPAEEAPAEEAAAEEAPAEEAPAEEAPAEEAAEDEKKED